jgi:hypothetical protein
VSNELSNYCGADRHPPPDYPGSFGAPSLAIDDHLTCFTPKKSPHSLMTDDGMWRIRLFQVCHLVLGQGDREGADGSFQMGDLR